MKKLPLLILFIVLSTSLHAYQKKIVLGSFSNKRGADIMINSLPVKTPALYEMSKEYNFNFSVKESGKYYILVAEVFESPSVLLAVLKESRKRFPGAYANESTIDLEKEETAQEVEKPIKNADSILVADKQSIREEKPILKVEEISSEISTVINPKVQKEKDLNDTQKVKSDEEPVTVAKAAEVIQEVQVNEINESVEENKSEVEVVVAEAKEPKKAKEADIESEEGFFHWSYIVILIFLGVGTHYFRRFKKIYDEY